MKYTIKNNDLKVEILSMGASITSMEFNKNGAFQETTLQYEDVNDYENKNSYYLNSIIGPHSGRIKNGQYHIDGELVQLDKNDRGNHLHGSDTGFHTLDFKLVSVEDDSLILKADDLNNKCEVKVEFKLVDSSLKIKYEVLTHITQVFNMTQHTYFNLSGEDTIENHRIMVPANQVVFLDESGAPERLVDVEGPFDLREFVELKDAMSLSHEQFEITGNIDHPFLIENSAVRLESDQSKLGVAVSSTAPYVVVYTGNYFLGENDFKDLGASKMHQAVAIEPQDLPNDVNLSLSRNQIISENDIYTHEITYKFYNLD